MTFGTSPVGRYRLSRKDEVSITPAGPVSRVPSEDRYALSPARARNQTEPERCLIEGTRDAETHFGAPARNFRRVLRRIARRGVETQARSTGRAVRAVGVAAPIRCTSS
jgi:hypothetical protein